MAQVSAFLVGASRAFRGSSKAEYGGLAVTRDEKPGHGLPIESLACESVLSHCKACKSFYICPLEHMFSQLRLSS